MEMLVGLLCNLLRNVNCVIPNDVCVVLADGEVCWEAGGRRGDTWRWDNSPEVAALVFLSSLWHFLDSEGLILAFGWFSFPNPIRFIPNSLLFQRKRAEPCNQQLRGGGLWLHLHPGCAAHGS